MIYYTKNMLALIGYLALIFGLLFFLIGTSVYIFSLIYSSLMGAPYVPTKQNEVNAILDEINLTKNSYFIELGCGDGRMIRTAALKFQLKGMGIDINPLLLYIARLKARWQGLNHAIFFHQKNIFNVDLRQGDCIYLFLMPKMIEKLKSEFDKQLKPNTLIISHGFKINKFNATLIKKLNHHPFPTYFYRHN